MNKQYKKQVALLIRIMPSVYRIADFAVHGGTAINLFYKEMPRYSVDIDITYIPLKGRNESLQAINVHLIELKQMIEKTIPGIRITHKPDVWKLLCIKDGATVKIEVNGTKRGIIGTTEDKELCLKAQKEFNMTCRARTVSFSQLYGGKKTLFCYWVISEISAFEQFFVRIVHFFVEPDIFGSCLRVDVEVVRHSLRYKAEIFSSSAKPNI
jgi:hypothetical protein